ncbi:MAG: SusC/RagA family TonB-linked outer membrane protein [Janthinobacterium lividum]
MFTALLLRLVPIHAAGGRRGRAASLTGCVLCLNALNSPAFAQFASTQQAPRRAAQPALVPLKKVLAQWEKQYDSTIGYASDLVRDKRVSLQTEPGSLEEKLTAVLSQVNLRFEKLSTNRYVIVPIATPANDSGSKSFTVAGRVIDAKGAGLPGVTVVVRGTILGSSTGSDGSFMLNVPPNSTLVFSSVGFVRQKVAVNSTTSSLTVNMLEGATELDGIILVGYGEQKKSQVTGAISSVTEQQLRDVPVANVGQALQGRAAGVSVASTTNRPGQSPTIRIRGNRSIGSSNNPLLVVDGIPYDGSFNDLNPDDITSLEVLKDASATAIYGARGANGVILIATQRGMVGAPHVTYGGYYGVKKPWRYDLMTGEQYYKFRRESFLAAGRNPDTATEFLTEDEKQNYEAGRTIDYQTLLYQDGAITNQSLGVLGGSEQTKYSASVGYYNEAGVLPVQDFKRYSVRATLDQQIGKRVKLGINSINGYTVEKDPLVSPMYQIMTASPLATPTGADGKQLLYPNGNTQLVNPLTLYVEDAHKQERRRLRTFNSLYGQVDILKGLDYRLNLGLDARTESFDSFFATNTPSQGTGQSTASRDNSFSYNLTAENLLHYTRTIKQHTLDFTGLFSVQEYQTDNTNVTARDLPTNYQSYYNIGAAAGATTASSGYQKWDFVSYMGRLNYSFNDRYSATLTLRYDGSSRLAKGNKYKAFPSAAVAWNITSESFMSSMVWVSNLKLRASYGRTGNSAVNPYQTLGLLRSQGGSDGIGYYNFGQVGAVGVVPGSVPNPALGWEYTTTANLGVDFSFFQNRVSGSVEVYQQRTSDLLLPDVLPPSTGYSTFTHNTGQTENRGLEVTLRTVNVHTANGFEWSTDWNFTLNRERIISLGLGKVDGIERSDLSNQRFIGQPIYVFYDLKKVGIWQTDDPGLAQYGAKPGDVKIQDTNNDGKISSADRIVLGSRQPKFEAGITNRLKYKGFDLSTVAFARVGSMIADPILAPATYYSTFQGGGNMLNLDYWTPQNPTNDFPRPNQSYGNYPLNATSYAYVSGTFAKIRSIDLGYTLPTRLAKKAAMSNARIYVQALNPFIFAAHRGNNKAIDPDALTYSSSLGRTGLEFPTGLGGPASRSFIMGMNLGF